MASALELAKFSRAAYDGINPDPIHWEKLAPPKNPIGGYVGLAYINHAEREIVIANKGTSPTQVQDLWNDVKLSFGVLHDGQLAAANYAEEIYSAYPGYHIIETGHSLGGNEAQAGLAKLIALGASASGATFNAPGIGGYDHDCSFARRIDPVRLTRLPLPGERRHAVV